jgi:carbon monoxide dehydrogenase subunit G
MKLENSFEVPAPKKQAWDLLMDVPRVVPCMPGATLGETVSDNRWSATMAVRLGPVLLQFDTDVTREAASEEAGVVTLSARARERRGRGDVKAGIQSTLTEVDGGTRIDIVTDLTLSGNVAQYGGRGILQDVSMELVNRFAECLKAQFVAATHVDPEPPEAPPVRPVGGLSLAVRAIWRSFLRLIRRPRP